jgi:hypothetical protein
MPVSFTPKTEKQLHEETLIPAGIYPFRVLTAEDKRSKAGNDMIEVELQLFMPDGRTRSLTDWLMAKMQFKLFHFCAYTGLAMKYDAGTLAATDCIGREGFAKIGVQADKSGQYPDRNNVADYMRDAGGGMKGATVAPSAARPQPTEAQLSNTAPAAGGPEPEDVPF